MARALSVNLQDRVVAAIAGSLSRRQGCGTLRCQRRERCPVAVACKSAWDAGAAAAGWRSTFDEDRGACRVDHTGLQGDA